ncbi:acyl-CoA dehydrogenase [Burkholderia sp. BCC1998]|uniref:acyl-CoA dehydrogenase n=1 Tax=Burkholderia sp. BCC1998 TaxID=2817447 RepID=UPI002AB751DB|nr:acyl-CoA dehydrogenase [Burkholderia sp. BCC1998]
MDSYIVPLEEMQFVLRELSDIERVLQTPNVECLADAELTTAILSQAAHFSKEVLAPLNAVGDREGAHWTQDGVTTAPGFKEAYRQFVEADWNKLSMPPEYGGHGMPILMCTALREIFTGANKAFCICTDLTDSAVQALLLAANDSLKSYYVPKLVSGDWAATMNLTEPHAGSDVGALRTRAVAGGDGTYRLFGQKIFISFGEHDLTENIVHLVLARIVGAPEGARGISLFAVPKFLPQQSHQGARNDVRCAGIEHKLGNHGSPTCTMVYGGEENGAIGWMVGEENKGLQTMFVMMNEARFHVGMEAVAVSDRAYRQAIAYAEERVQGRAADGGDEAVPIIRHPDVRRMLLSMRSQIEAMRALGYLIAAAQDLAHHHPDPAVRNERREFVDLMIPVFKGWATETAVEVTRTSVQIHGGLGYVEESGASQPLRDVLICPIYEGTTGIQANDLISRKILRDGGAGLRDWLTQVELTQAELEAEPTLGDIGLRLLEGTTALRCVAKWIVEEYQQRPLEVLAGAVPFLRMMGIVAGGWQMARAALASYRALKTEADNSRFLQAKLTSAHFYSSHILPQVPALATSVVCGGAATLSGTAFCDC